MGKRHKIDEHLNSKYYDTDNNFKGRHFTGFIILQCLRWYCKYALSYRDLEEIMKERGVSVILHLKF